MINKIFQWCKDKWRGAYFGSRNSKWSVVRKTFLNRRPTPPICVVCGGKEKLEVHHIKSFHEHPELELDFNNLIILCESKKMGVSCHQFFGHLGNYKKINPSVVEDTLVWREKLL